jgi:glucokinase
LKQIIGIDIGGTKIAIGLFDETGRFIASSTIPTHAQAPFSEAIVRIFEAVDELLGNTTTLTGIGIGCAGPLDTEKGVVQNPYTLSGWENAPIVATLSDRYGCPVRLENDADVALLGEVFAHKKEKPVRNALMLTFGTGVGGAVLHNGKLFKTENFGHPEFGHILVAPGEGECYCGGDGCLEGLASGLALTQQAQALGFEDFQDLVAQGGLQGSGKFLVHQWVERVGRALWTLVHIFSPSMVILGGGAMSSLFDLVNQKITENMQSGIFYKEFALVEASLGAEAGMVGAATLVLPV